MKKNEVSIKDCQDLMMKSKNYRKVLKHRQTCNKWGKEFCLDCFGGGLTQFTKNLETEFKHQKKGKM